MDVHIRKAVEGDQAAIRDLVREAGISPFHLYWQHFVVAQGPTGVVGCGQVRPHHDGTGELASIAVTPSYQGRGIGRAIVATLVDCGVRDLYLMAEGKNQGFYEPFGFRVVGARDLPAEMQPLFSVGLAVTWVARHLFHQPVRIVGMRLFS